MSAQIDIFAQITPPTTDLQQAEHLKVFEHLKTSKFCASDRKYVNEIYGRYVALGLSDPGLRRRVPREFVSRVFEMWLAYVLDGWGWSLVPPAKRGHDLDFG